MKLNLLKNKTTELTFEQINRINYFVNESAETHIAQGRTIEKVKNDIETGKKGEFILKQLCNEFNIKCTDVKLENKRYGDGGVDLICDDENIKTDVKTLDQKWKNRVYLGSSTTNDMWSVVLLIGNTGTYLGSLFRKDIKISDLKYDKENNNAVYIHRSLFENSDY